MNENREVIKKAMEMQFLETEVSLKKKSSDFNILYWKSKYKPCVCQVVVRCINSK